MCEILSRVIRKLNIFLRTKKIDEEFIMTCKESYNNLISLNLFFIYKKYNQFKLRNIRKVIKLTHH
jgi:hypothetical protein